MAATFIIVNPGHFFLKCRLYGLNVIIGFNDTTNLPLQYLYCFSTFSPLGNTMHELI